MYNWALLVVKVTGREKKNVEIPLSVQNFYYTRTIIVHRSEYVIYLVYAING